MKKPIKNVKMKRGSIEMKNFSVSPEPSQVNFGECSHNFDPMMKQDSEQLAPQMVLPAVSTAFSPHSSVQMIETSRNISKIDNKAEIKPKLSM